MKLFFHIGMGKTGTTSIQTVLDHNRELLKAQHAMYLGGSFSIIDSQYNGFDGLNKFLAQSNKDIENSIEKFISTLEKINSEENIEKFIISSEALSGKYNLMNLTINLLKRRLEVEVVVYVRNPIDWLPSAYIQWGVRHKLNRGKVLSYEKMATELIKWYEHPLKWFDLFPGIVSIRHYDKTDNVVSDFLEYLNLNINVPNERYFQRGNRSELLFRAIFNDLFEGSMLPSVFENSVLKNEIDIHSVKKIEKMIFDYSSTNSIVDENIEIFLRYKKDFSINLIDEVNKVEGKDITVQDTDNEVLDYLIEIVLRQSIRIKKLEKIFEQNISTRQKT